MGVSERVCTQKVVGHWDRLPREGKGSWHQACQSLRSIWTMLSNTWFDFGVVLCGAESDSMILADLFQLGIFCDTIILWLYTKVPTALLEAVFPGVSSVPSSFRTEAQQQ